jgi:glutathione peroxidase
MLPLCRKLPLAAAVMMLSSLFSAAAQAPAINWQAMPLPSLDGGVIDPATLEGHAVLVVNTASFCGFTPQYEGLQALWERYRDEGLVVLGVPSDDFGGQEYESNGEIKTFCTVTFGIDFPMLTRQQVTGGHAHPLFAWIAREAGVMGSPKWNFYKYLIGPDGRLVEWYSSAELAAAIEDAIAAQP